MLATTDTHGNILPYDYFTKQKPPRGLAKIATLVDAVRKETKHTLLVDCGDTIQGSPLASVYEVDRREGRTRAPEPMMLAMNAIGYDAMAVGNHEYNFGLEALQAARAAARFPWLSANTETGAALPPFAPYLVKTVAGVKVAVIGLTTPVIPQWEKPEHIRGLSWLDPVTAVRRTLAALEAERPDVVLVAIHGGLGRDPETGAPARTTTPGENPVWALAETFPGLDGRDLRPHAQERARAPRERRAAGAAAQLGDGAGARRHRTRARCGRTLQGGRHDEPAAAGDGRDSARPAHRRAGRPVPGRDRALARHPGGRVEGRARAARAAASRTSPSSTRSTRRSSTTPGRR